MSESKAAPPAAPPLYKQRPSWCADTYRDEAWLKRKGNNHKRRLASISITDEDLDDLKACIELGFGFDSPDLDHRLSDTLPALGLFFAVNKQYIDSISKSSSSSPPSDNCDDGSPHIIFSSGEDPGKVKTRLRQWAQVVACSVRQSSY